VSDSDIGPHVNGVYLRYSLLIQFTQSSSEQKCLNMIYRPTLRALFFLKKPLFGRGQVCLNKQYNVKQH